MRKIHRHPRYSVMIPESTNPSTRPQLATAAHTLRARVRARPSGNNRTMVAIAAGRARASPAPWSSLAPTSSGNVSARPAISEAAPKIAVPMRRRWRRPKTSPSRPPSINKPPPVMVYPTTTQVRPRGSTPRSFPMDGSATLTTVTSTAMRNCRMDRHTRTAQERAGDTCAGCDEEVLKDTENSVARMKNRATRHVAPNRRSSDGT